MDVFSTLNPQLVEETKLDYLKNDAGHQFDHAILVAETVLEIIKHHFPDAGVSMRQGFLLASLLHDRFVWVDRKKHHILASEWVCNNLADYGYDYHVVDIVADMCLDHRASGKERYLWGHTEVFSAADRGKPDFEQRVLRCNSSKLDLPIIDRYVEVAKHLKDKYGKEGYARKNYIYESFYANALEEFNNKLNTFNYEVYLDILTSNGLND